MKKISELYDERSLCSSIIIEVELKDYLKLVKNIFNNQGSIQGQRGAVKTKSAKTIRDRMVEDIKKGALLPPVVIGAISKETDIFKILKEDGKHDVINLSIIDGMQRTAAYIEALNDCSADEKEKLNKKIIRVEFWLGKTMNSLLYRMLVLNTGQIPWNARRQLETIYTPVIEQVENNVKGITLQKIDEGTKRSRAGQFPADKIMELLICFTLRSPIVNMKDAISEEFAKLDIIETSSHNNFDEYFMSSLSLLVTFDRLIFECKSLEMVAEDKYNLGKDLFTSQPARIGLITAISKYIFGLKGSKQSVEKTSEKMKKVNEKFKIIFDRLEAMSPQEMSVFLAFDTLNEKTSILTSKVGDFERKYFTSSFEMIFTNLINLHDFDLSVLWRNE